MSLLQELNTVLSPLFSVETGVFSQAAPDTYLVLTPVVEQFVLSADNTPLNEVQEVRISLFSKGSYTKEQHNITRLVLSQDITVTDRRYLGHEDQTGYHHYAIDVAKEYEMEE